MVSFTKFMIFSFYINGKFIGNLSGSDRRLHGGILHLVGAIKFACATCLGEIMIIVISPHPIKFSLAAVPLMNG